MFPLEERVAVRFRMEPAAAWCLEQVSSSSTTWRPIPTPLGTSAASADQNGSVHTARGFTKNTSAVCEQM